ncbi:hypothetical protein GWI33_004714 [Rhynchophorus ferrugineus]|uniref:Uncharacterized protein n=1 Tax=Rhynchophorus ferrugineus TaxID=354439 RepID=A0A834ILY6_RHYFE|nr:hypothetical protein GWI33_004714 [Rhynchophorus ferrugineus]
MTVILVSVFLVFVANTIAKVTLPPELQEYVDEIHSVCLSKSGLTEDHHSAYDIKHKDEKMMCYMKCLMLESKWMTTDGTIDYEFIEAQSYPEVKDILMAALDKCKNIDGGSDLCEKAYNFNYCLHQADPENWFLV